MNQIDPNQLAERLQVQLLETKPHHVGLLHIPMEQINNININLLKALLQLNLRPIYVSLIKSYDELSNLLRQGGVISENIDFIDGISTLYGISQSDEDNVSYVASPISLDAIISLIGKLSQSDSRSFVYVDSLTGVMLYNSQQQTIRFIKDLNKILQTNNLNALTSVYDDESLKKKLKKSLEHETVMVELFT